MTKKGVYVAGSWANRLTEAQPMIDRLKAVGIWVTHDWTRVPEEHEDNPAGRRTCAEADLHGVSSAYVLWLMAPQSGGQGCWVELGYALADDVRVVVSGPGARRTIFTELVAETFENHEDALMYVTGMCRD